MADRTAPIRKTPAEILTDLMEGHNEALYSGADKAKKYLMKFSERNTSLPNAVKFFLYDLLAEDAYQAGDLDTCRASLDNAAAVAQTRATVCDSAGRRGTILADRCCAACACACACPGADRTTAACYQHGGQAGVACRACPGQSQSGARARTGG